MSPLISTIIGGLFLFSGAVAVYTMMSKMGRRQISNPERYRTLHHITGWIFVILFLIMFVFMLARIEHFGEESSPRITVHISLAMVLLVLLVIKVKYDPEIVPEEKINEVVDFLVKEQAFNN